MSFVSEGRIGLRPEISGFVVTEDRSLEARLKRAYHTARTQALAVARPRPDEAAASTVPFPAAPASASDAPLSVARGDDLAAMRNRSIMALKAVPRQLAALLPDRERLKDVAALALIAGAALTRQVWRLPRLAKIGLFGLCLAGVVLMRTGPSEMPAQLPAQAETPSPAVAEVPPAPPPVAAAAPVAAPPAVRWRTIAAPIPSYNLEAPELNRAAATLKARAASDGARQEIHLWSGTAGKSRSGSLTGMLTIEHYPTTPPAETLYVDLVRRAALLGASVERTGELVGLESKFGEIDTVEARIVAAGENEAQSCIAFRRIETSPTMQVHGWFCGTTSTPVDRATLGCIVDRIDLMRAGSDVTLKRYFARVERARKPCGAPRQAVARPGWIDASGAMPPLKSAIPASASRG